MQNIIALFRRNVFALFVGLFAVGSFGYLTFSGKECFNCKQTETYKSEQRGGGAYLRFRHK